MGKKLIDCVLQLLCLMLWMTLLSRRASKLHLPAIKIPWKSHLNMILVDLSDTQKVRLLTNSTGWPDLVCIHDECW